MKQIMIVEDDIGLNEGIEMALKGADYCFLKCYTFKEAEKCLEAGRPDMVLLDVNLPDGSGYDLLKKIRSGSELPVILLTANDMETDEVMGLSLGADDYITKPFSLMVLRARIENLFRRSKTAALAVFELDDLYLDFSRLVFKKGENELVLSKTEQKLLRIFLENRGRILPRNTLLEKYGGWISMWMKMPCPW